MTPIYLIVFIRKNIFDSKCRISHSTLYRLKVEPGWHFRPRALKEFKQLNYYEVLAESLVLLDVIFNWMFGAEIPSDQLRSA